MVIEAPTPLKTDMTDFDGAKIIDLVAFLFQLHKAFKDLYGQCMMVRKTAACGFSTSQNILFCVKWTITGGLRMQAC